MSLVIIQQNIYGGAIATVDNVVLSLNETNNFLNYAVTNISLIFMGTNNFTHNSAGNAGGAVVTGDNGVLTFNGTNNFINNSARDGGAICALTNTNMLLSFIGANNFTHNSAGYEGGAIYTKYNAEFNSIRTNNFISNSANNGGAIYAAINISLIFIGIILLITQQTMVV